MIKAAQSIVFTYRLGINDLPWRHLLFVVPWLLSFVSRDEDLFGFVWIFTFRARV